MAHRENFYAPFQKTMRHGAHGARQNYLCVSMQIESGVTAAVNVYVGLRHTCNIIGSIHLDLIINPHSCGVLTRRYDIDL